MKNKVGGQLRKNKAEDTTQHGAVGSNRGIRKRKRAAKIKQEVSHLRNRRLRNRMAMAMAPGTLNRPLGLVIHSRGATTAVGNLMSHRLREVGMTCGYTIRSQLKHGEVLVVMVKMGLSEKKGTSTRSSRRSGNQGCCGQNGPTSIGSNPQDCRTFARTHGRRPKGGKTEA